ncbi:MAG: 4Fe-4S dicluster domain-containing protein [Ruminiclostridium sp.]|nr:4Fe-4S dicluster domain-containing protein [Ruminiclostridium sp.]
MMNLSSTNMEFKNRVAAKPGGEKVMNCFLCGTCTAGCPVSALNGEYNPRRIMRIVLLGMEQSVLSSPQLWQCSQCHTCVAHCPQDVRFADVMRVLRELALEDGIVSREFVEDVDKVDREVRQERIYRINKLSTIEN